MEYTKNYKLPQWVETDRILMEDFNQMCSDIDAGIAAVRESAAASQETASSAKTTAESAAAFIGGTENCRISAGSYVGSDLCGAENPTTLEFSFKPLLMILREAGTAYRDSCIFVRGSRSVNNELAGGITSLTWGDNSISWYAKDDPDYQLNSSSKTYVWVAIGCAE